MTNTERSQLSLELLPAVRAGDRAAQEKFFALHTPLVHKIARRYQDMIRPGGLEYEDLVQEGNIGILVAIKKFDEMRGVRFGTYAMFWIRQQIGRCLEEQNQIIRVPAHALKNVFIPVDSLDAPANPVFGTKTCSGEVILLVDAIADPTSSFSGQVELEKLIAELLIDLKENERMLLLRWAGGESLREIGESLGFGRERARQIKEEALGKVRQRAKQEMPEEFEMEHQPQWYRSGRSVW